MRLQKKFIEFLFFFKRQIPALKFANIRIANAINWDLLSFTWVSGIIYCYYLLLIGITYGACSK